MGIYFADRAPMREGLPSAIASGLVIGAGEGLVIAAFGSSHGSWDFPISPALKSWVRPSVASEASPTDSARPTPQRNVFLTSAATWGAALGYELGGGVSTGAWSSSDTGGSSASQTVSVGGVVGYNLGVLGAAAVSAVWTPSWEQLGWMWGGFGIGEAVSALVFPVYAATGGDARHGFVFQGVAGAVGIAAGAFVGRPDHRRMAAEDVDEHDWMRHPRFARIRGAGILPVPGGAGATVMGELW